MSARPGRLIRWGLGRHPEAASHHDPRSRSFAAPADLPAKTVTWRRYGPVLDQGQVGSCTGNATAQVLNHRPFHIVGTSCYREVDALRFYRIATEVDPYPGSYPAEDTGSDGLSVAKAAQQLGAITGYTHAFGLDHVLSAAQAGPLIVGTDWYDGMFHPDGSGQVFPSGSIAGGHEYTLDGVNVEHKMLRFLNSWGSGWGARGRFYQSFDNFSKLLAAGGDAVLFTR